MGSVIGSEFFDALNKWLSGFPAVTTSIGEAAIVRIRQRTQYENTDRFGNQFQPYSELNTKKNTRKIGPETRWAKRKKSAIVNLTKSGRMLGNLQVLSGGTAKANVNINNSVSGKGGRFESIKDQTIVIGFSDPREGKKAWAHITGESPVWRESHVRDFMGVEELWIGEATDKALRQYGPVKSTKQTMNGK
jgi:hypothetical protein